MSGPQTRHVRPLGLVRLSSQVLEVFPGHVRPQARHVWPLNLIQVSSQVPERWVGHIRPPLRTCPGFWHPNSSFGCPGKTGLSGFWNWTIIRFLKPDYPVFACLNPWTELTPSRVFSLLSPSHSRTTVGATPRPPLAIPWFLCEILEFLGEINSPRTGVFVPPTNFSSSQDIFT
jgi:hypothetical protein